MALVRRIHNRMPVIYDTPMGRQWLHGPFSLSCGFLLAV